MIRETANALLACVVTFALCAVAYPAAVYGIGHGLFPGRAEGSLIVRDGKVIGSALIAQPFASDKYFRPRPSAAGPNGYAADAASGSNLATTNPALRDRIALDAARLIAARSGDAHLGAEIGRLDSSRAALKARGEIKDPTAAEAGAIAGLEGDAATAMALALVRSARLGEAAENLAPVDLVTASGSGLDPDISPEAAHYQAARVARARGVPVERIREMIDGLADRSGAILGAPARVNVLLLNLGLDEAGGTAGPIPSIPTPTGEKP